MHLDHALEVVGGASVENASFTIPWSPPLKTLPAVILTLTLALSSSALAKSLPDGGISGEEMIIGVAAAGYAGKDIASKDHTDPLIKTTFSGQSAIIILRGCEKGRCRTFQIYTSIGGKTNKVTLAKINEWNRGHAFGRAYLDGDGDPVMEMDVNAEHGFTTESLSDAISLWSVLSPTFAKFIAAAAP